MIAMSQTVCRRAWLVWFFAASIVSPSESYRAAFVIPSRPRSRLLPAIQSKDLQRIPLQSPVRKDHPFFALAGSSNRDEDDHDDDDDHDDSDEVRRKRDRLKDWFSSSGKSPDSPMVRPIRMEDGSVIEPEEEQDRPRRVKAKFDNLFAGMPTVGEILGSSDSNEENDDDESSHSSSNNSLEDDIAESAKFQQRRVDESWFDAEKQQIMDGYEDVLQNMLADLEQQRQQDPESVPQNAEAMIKSVLKQEMDREIEATKEARAQEQVEAYEREQLAQAERKDISGPPDEKVQELLQKSEEEYAQQEASRARVEDFLRYEQQAFQRATEESAQVSSPTEGQDLDEWVLRRLESEVAKQQEENDEGTILDIVEENLEDLRERIEKESRRGSIRPETMKEWQMYRAITTRLIGGDANVKESDIEDEILEQLESWKEYVQKEEGFRKDSGLSRGPKLPFDWQEAKVDAGRTQIDTSSPPPDLRAKVEARKEINRQSIEALESLLKTADPQRRQKLQEEIDFLKTALEGNDYLDVDEAYLEAEEPVTGPVDVSDVFSTSVFDEKETSSLFEPELDATSTPFFEQSSGRDEEEFKTSQPKPPPPSTPFFMDTTSDEEATATTDSKLGSIEDQKLEAMYRRAGAKTAEERRSIKKQWEEFQDIERQKRELSGLSGGDDSDLLPQTSLDYDMSEVVKGDGDIDADKILASIGPRPTRKKKSGASSQNQTGENYDTDIKGESAVDENEVLSSMYRAASAVGGGRFKDDPDEDMRQKASFEEFIKKENEVRQSLDTPVEPSEGEISVDTNLDDVGYAEEVLSSLGPRPKPKRTRITDEGDFSDKGGILASKDDDEEEDDEESDAEDIAFEDQQFLPDMPEWLRREKEDEKSGKPLRSKTFLGNDIDEVFDDTDYDKNMRQLHEYEQRRTGRERQMGIDISDVLGRTSDDYADYKYDNDYQRGRRDNWGTVSFESRKKDLLDYTELEVLELNALMDHKNSVYATGVSEYMPRINKPFKAFGAIFRLEGVLLDLTGLQLKSWSEVADEYGFKPPTPEDVRRAAVTRPDIAVKESFFWSDDFLLCRKVAMSHRKAFRKFFDAWVEGSGLEVPSAVETEQAKGSMALGQEFVEETPTPRRVVAPKSEGERVHSAAIAWAKAAEELGKRPPTETEVLYAELLSPDIAVVRVLRWASDPVEVDRIVQVYEGYYADPEREVRKVEPTSSTDAASKEAPASSSKLHVPRSQNEMMEVHFQAWNVVSETFGFDPPLPEEAMAAFVINDPLIAIRDGFGWTNDSEMIAAAANKFEEALSEFLHTEAPSQIKETKVAESFSQVQPLGPSADDLFKASFEAWSAVAAKAGFDPPDEEQIQFALSVGPEEAVITGFQWTNDEQVVEELVEAYRMELASKRMQWVSSDTPDGTVPPRPVKAVASSNIGPSADDIYQVAFDAWSETAKKHGYEKPDDEQVQFALSVGPEEAVVTGFQWTDDPAEVAKVVEVYKEELSQRRSAWSSFVASQKEDLEARERSRDTLHDVVLLPGAAKWVKSLIDVEMHCGVISFMDRDQVDVLLQYAGLAELFPPDKRVSANNGYNRESQQMLGAALRLETRPDHCVVFDTTPYSAAAAHDVEMRSVGLIGPFPRFELLSADTTSNSFEDVTAMNIRRLFGERVYDQTMLDTQQADPQRRQRTKTKYFWDDD